MGGDFASERNSLMNIFFAAHKHEVVVDVANIGKLSQRRRTVLSFMSQVSSLMFCSVLICIGIFDCVT